MDLSKEMLVDIVINIINILVLFFVVKALAYKPVKRFMQNRAEKTLEAKAAAEALYKESEEKISEYSALVSESKKAKEKAIEEGEKEGREEAAAIIADAEQKAEKILLDAEKKAEELKKKAVEDAREEIIETAIEASEKLLLREVSDSDNIRFVKRFIGEKSEGEENA